MTQIVNPHPQQPQNNEYGILLYDIPMVNQRLYQRLNQKIRRYALRINWSVYLLPWGFKETIEKLCEDEKNATGEIGDIYILKFENKSEDEVKELAKESLKRELSLLKKRIEKRINEHYEGKTIKEYYFTRIKKEFDYLVRHTLLFYIREATEDAIKATEQALKVLSQLVESKTTI